MSQRDGKVDFTAQVIDTYSQSFAPIVSLQTCGRFNKASIPVKPNVSLFFLLVAQNVGAKLAALWNPKSGILTRRWSKPSCVIIFLSGSATFHPSHLTLRGWLALLQDSGKFKKIKYEDTYWLRCHNVQFIRDINMDRLRFTSLVRLAPRILVFNNAITGRLMSMIYGTALPRVRCTDECVWMCKPGVTYSHRPSAPSALLWAVRVQCGGHL